MASMPSRVASRITSANSFSSSGCAANQSHADVPYTSANELLPVRTLAASPDHAPPVYRRPMKIAHARSVFGWSRRSTSWCG